jgi:hypothetical protein
MYDMLFFETSALSGYNVQNMFYIACEKIIDQINGGIICTSDESNGIKLGNYIEPKIKKKQCCNTN